MSDAPFDRVVEEANSLLKNPNVTIHQKFTCSSCGNRLTMEEPNTFYTTGTCDKCGTITDIRKKGCDFLMIVGLKV